MPPQNSPSAASGRPEADDCEEGDEAIEETDERDDSDAADDALDETDDVEDIDVLDALREERELVELIIEEERDEIFLPNEDDDEPDDPPGTPLLHAASTSKQRSAENLGMEVRIYSKTYERSISDILKSTVSEETVDRV
jgi:hypothetical protein